jgi:hypothetical protein
MKPSLGQAYVAEPPADVPAASLKNKLFAVLEVLLVFAAIQTLAVLWTSTEIVQWEKEHLGWSYSAMLFYIGIPAVVVSLSRRGWAAFGVSSADWPTNHDIGMKALIVQFIPIVFGLGGAAALKLDYKGLGGVFVAVTEAIALGLMIWIMNRQKPVRSGRRNVIITIVVLLLPIVIALALGTFSLVVVSTIVWQFVFSGFGEEFVWRGYVQSRLNQAFGRPLHWFGIQFGAGLIIASLLFGLNHAFGTFKPELGLASLSWGWALWTSVAGLVFGVIREKTGTLVAPGIAHGLPDAFGEAIKIAGGV